MESQAYLLLDKMWKSATKIVFGKEMGELSAYSDWLSSMADKVFERPSYLSGKGVSFASDEYWTGSKRMGFTEVDFGKGAPISMNEIKDLDSLVNAISERVCYTGDMVLGNSRAVEKSSNVSDSFYVYSSSEIGDSKYVAYSSMARLCEYVFGCAAPGESSYMIRCNDTYRSKRCFELWMAANSTDCYYVFNLNNCSNCMFSFNLRTTRNAIGNRVLEKGVYSEVKARLLEQMAADLKAKKKLPSLLDVVKRSEYAPEEARAAVAGRLDQEKEEKSLKPMEEAFSQTCKLLLGAELRGLENYSKWLTRHVPRDEARKSVLSGRELFVSHYANYIDVPRDRTVIYAEALKLVEFSKPQEGVEKISMENAHELVGKIAYFSLNFYDGTNTNVVDCMAYAYSTNVYHCAPCVQVKNAAYNMWPRSSENVFGNGILLDSSYCIHCYQSVKLNRCFEVDSGRGCSDCYFCHNVENLHDCMFCFNAKNLKFAVGNVELGKEEYLRLKGILLGEIAAGLKATKDFSLDIYNVGSGKV